MSRRNSVRSNQIILLYCLVNRNMQNWASGKRKRNELYQFHLCFPTLSCIHTYLRLLHFPAHADHQIGILTFARKPHPINSSRPQPFLARDVTILVSNCYGSYAASLTMDRTQPTTKYRKKKDNTRHGLYTAWTTMDHTRRHRPRIVCGIILSIIELLLPATSLTILMLLTMLLVNIVNNIDADSVLEKMDLILSLT